MKKMRVGLIGCGNVSRIYLKTNKIFDNIEIVAFSDIIMERARQFSIPKPCAAKELLSDQTIDIILNLTTPEVYAAGTYF